MLKFAIIGAGAGGQSMAAILTSKGYIAKLYDIDKEKIHRLQELKTIKVTGVIACEAAPAVITDRIDEVMDDVDVIMVWLLFRRFSPPLRRTAPCRRCSPGR